ncbi:MAG TPA: aldo/keto reductase [Alphaproteobacteria bacterium]|nr:aldo/keto reductase [Alphaproteobacteria bacterium]
MKFNPLGRTAINVSRVCMGTMTFGRQVAEADAHRIMDLALDHGVNFIDTAEMYPFPAEPDDFNLMERIVGSWMKARGNRDKIVLATKIVGPGARFNSIRGGSLKNNRHHIERAIDQSLKSLGTDYIDLYQIHWPDRATNFFGRLGYEHVADDDFTPLEETLSALSDQVAAGKVRAIGLSNETPWGLMKFIGLSERLNLIRPASVQNPYSLLNRTYEIGLAEVSIREDCGLLAYSPLAFGVVSGKYLSGARPKGARLTLFPQFKRYLAAEAAAAVGAYVRLGREAGLDPAAMAIAFVNSRPFVTSTIIGVTTAEQLKVNLSAEGVVLPGDVISAIEDIHRKHPNPAP